MHCLGNHLGKAFAVRGQNQEIGALKESGDFARLDPSKKTNSIVSFHSAGKLRQLVPRRAGPGDPAAGR